MSDIISRSELYNLLRQYLYANGCQISKEVRVDEKPQVLRHACLQTGVVFLPIQIFQPFGIHGAQVCYYLCKNCGKLFIVRD